MIYTAGRFANHIQARGANVRVYGDPQADAALLIDHDGRHATATFSETGRFVGAVAIVGDDTHFSRSLKGTVELLGLPAPATAAQTAGR